MTADLYQLIYVSRNMLSRCASEMDAKVRSILAVSQGNNSRAGVTGALLFNDDCFAQVLEGGIGAVHATFERIECDARHRRTVVLRAGPVDVRSFGDWSMACAGRTDHGAMRFEILSGGRSRPAVGTRSGAANSVMALLHGVVARAETAA